jgi:hypothetical protein
MKVAAITRFKHGSLYELLREIGWSQSRFAIESGMNVTRMGLILNLLKRPSEKDIQGMEMAFGKIGRFVDVASMFPESYIGFKRPLKIVQVQDVEPSQLEYLRQNQVQLLEDAQPPIPSDAIDTKEKLDGVLKMLEGSGGELTEKEQDMIRSHILEGEPFEHIGKRYGVSTQWANRQFMNGLRKIRSHFKKNGYPTSRSEVYL